VVGKKPFGIGSSVYFVTVSAKWQAVLWVSACSFYVLLCCEIPGLLAFSSTEAGIVFLQDWGGGCSLLNSATGLPQNCTGNGQVELPFGSREYLVSCSLISVSFMSFRTCLLLTLSHRC